MMININTGDKLIITDLIDENVEISPTKSFLSRIGDIYDQHHLLVYTPIAEGIYIRLPLEQEYSFIFYTSQGLYKADGKILEYCVQNKADLMKIEVGDYASIQRRNFYRLNFTQDFTFTSIADLTDEEIGDFVPVYRGVIKDISGGGLCFISGADLNQNEYIICNLTLKSEPITIEGKVLAKESLDNMQSRYLYRIDFDNINSAIQERIVQYVFYAQRQIIRRKKLESE